MKIKLCLLFFSFSALVQISYCQLIKGVLVDAETKKGVPFGSIFIKGKTEGGYADEQGKFEVYFSAKNLKDSVSFVALGYITINISLAELSQNPKDTFLLKNNPISLQEVVIRGNKGNTLKTFGFFKKKIAIAVLAYAPNSGVKMATLVENTEGKVGQIHTLKYRFFNDKNPLIKSFKLRLRIYSHQEGFPKNDLLTESVFVDLDVNQSILEYDILDKNIPFPTEGVLIGYDLIGVTNINNVFSKIGFGQYEKTTKMKTKLWSDTILAPIIDCDKSSKNKKGIMSRWGEKWWYLADEIHECYTPKFGLSALF